MVTCTYGIALHLIFFLSQRRTNPIAVFLFPQLLPVNTGSGLLSYL